MATPDETVLIDRQDARQELLKVGLIIPRLDVEGDDGLGGSLGLASGLLLLVLGESLGLDSLSLGILLLVRAKEVNIIVVLLLFGGGGSSSRSGSRAERAGSGGLVTRESGELLGVRGNVLVPAGSIDVLLGIGGRASGLVDSDISLGDGGAKETVSLVKLNAT